MDKLWQVITESVKYLWPFVIVHQWELGIYTVFGRYVQPWRIMGFRLRHALPKVLKPGLYIRIPFFTQLKEVTIAWDFVESGRLDVTLRDDRALTFEFTALARIVDPELAYFGFHDFEADLKKALRAAVADFLMSEDTERFLPERRGRLLGKSLLLAAQKAAAKVGHEVEEVSVVTFVLQPRIFRLLQDAPTAAASAEAA